MDKTIYLVMYAYYSDWRIYGYFTTRDEAEKYVVSHPSEELEIYEIKCLDNQADLSDVSVKYEFSVFFQKMIQNGFARWLETLTYINRYIYGVIIFTR